METVHYVCTGGCGGVSDKPGLCETAGCKRHGHPLTPCSCQDGKHLEVLTRAENDSAGQPKVKA